MLAERLLARAGYDTDREARRCRLRHAAVSLPHYAATLCPVLPASPMCHLFQVRLVCPRCEVFCCPIPPTNTLSLRHPLSALPQVRTLELLKLRFGEAALRVCDIMLKDVADSKRIDAGIQAESRGGGEGERLEGTNATIISAVFWPPLKGARSRALARARIACVRRAKGRRAKER